jgi:hypothetical protein
MPDRTRTGNEDYSWAKFDPDAYVAHYYGEPHPDDDEVLRLTCAALATASEGRELRTIDVGTGPNLFPLLAALPVARSQTAWEFSPSNIAWLQRELTNPELRPPWTHFWEVVLGAYDPARAAIAHPLAALAEKTEVLQGSIFDLPQAQWDCATMFFCAESITARQEEFELACAAYAKAVRPGGVLAAAFLAGSRGYRVGEEDFPAVYIGAKELEHAFEGFVDDLDMTVIGARNEEIRSGYSGMIFLTARVR